MNAETNMLPIAPGDTTVDAFLGGRVEAVQPRHGHHRSGVEAVLLAASLTPSFAGTLVDLGAGVGVAGMCAAARTPGSQVVLAERDAALVACAHAALLRPANAAFAQRVSVVAADIGLRETQRVAAGLGRAIADVVVMNPPFHESGQGTASPESARATAHILATGGLDPWIRTAASVLKPDGHLVVVFRADGLDALMTAFGRRFGSTSILPIHPRAALPAHRVLIHAIKGRRANSRILPSLSLHDDSGNAYLPKIDAMLRGGIGLSEAHPPWSAVG
jgi:tRNA1(Val) A37 N6-methylase TrmN6